MCIYLFISMIRLAKWKHLVFFYEIYLQQEGYAVLKAYDGEEALRVLKENEVQLLIMDVMMPKLDGIRATLKIREESSIPIIILSAKTEDSDKILGLNVGADDYLGKPFNPLELVARVKSQLRRFHTKCRLGRRHRFCGRGRWNCRFASALIWRRLWRRWLWRKAP